MFSSAEDWENFYITTKLEDLPWNAGGPDEDLVKLVKDGTIPVGQALDIGTGPGHDAVYLIKQGFNVIAIDVSPTAVTLARENASDAGLFGFFQHGDIRKIPVEDKFIDFANDRGCFHVLSAEDRQLAVSEVARVLKRRGLYFLKVFSDKQPGTDGPHRFSRKEIEDLFLPRFEIKKMWDGIVQSKIKPKCYSILMEKK